MRTFSYYARQKLLRKFNSFSSCIRRQNFSFPLTIFYLILHVRKLMTVKPQPRNILITQCTSNSYFLFLKDETFLFLFFFLNFKEIVGILRHLVFFWVVKDFLRCDLLMLSLKNCNFLRFRGATTRENFNFEFRLNNLWHNHSIIF